MATEVFNSKLVTDNQLAIGTEVVIVINHENNHFLFDQKGKIVGTDHLLQPLDLDGTPKNIEPVHESVVLEHYQNAEVLYEEDRLRIIRSQELHPDSREMLFSVEQHIYMVNLDGTENIVKLNRKQFRLAVEKDAGYHFGNSYSGYDVQVFREIGELLFQDEDSLLLNNLSNVFENVQTILLRASAMRNSGELSIEDYEKATSFAARLVAKKGLYKSN